MNKKRWLISLSALIVITLIFSVAIKPTKSSLANSSSISGIVEQEEYNLSFKIGGRIATLPVEEGQLVKKGEIIGTVEKGEWQAKVDQAQAAVGLASANVNKAITGVGVVDQVTQAKIEQAQAALKTAQDKFVELTNGARPEQITQLQAKVDATQSAYNNAQDMVNKMNALFEAGAIPQSKKDETDQGFEKAKAELTVAKQDLEMAQQGARQEDLDMAKHQVEQVKGALNEALSGKGQVQLSNGDVNVAKGQLSQAEASLEEALTYLDYTQLRAPVDGFVIRKNVKTGEMVSEGFTAITLAEPKDKWVKFYVPEDKLNQLKAGQKVVLSIPAIKEQVNGSVESVNPAPQFAAQKATNYLKDTDIRSFEVKVRLSEKTDQIMAGMTAEWQGAMQP